MSKMLPLIAFIFMATFCACSSDSGGPTGGSSLASKTLSIDKAGGEIILVTANDTQVVLNFAPSALWLPTEITLQELAPNNDSWLNIAISPAGLRLAAPLTIAVTPPSDVEPDDLTALQFRALGVPLYLGTEYDSGTRQLSAELWTLGIEDDSVAGLKAGPVGTLTVSSVDCESRVETAEAALQLLTEKADYKRALQLYQAYTALAEELTCQPDWEEWLVNARAAACEGFDSALITAEVQIPNDYGELYDVLTPVIYWASTASFFDAPCTGLDTWPSVMSEEFDQFLIFYNPVVDGVISGDFDTFKSVRQELRSLYSFYTEIVSLGFSFEADQLGNTKIRPLMNAVRKKAYTLCYDDNDHYFLTRMTYSGFLAETTILPINKFGPLADQLPFTDFDDTEIFRDLQYCASCLDVTYMVDDQILNTVSLGGGSEPGEETATSQISVHDTGIGKLVFGCDIRRLVCFPPSLNAGDSLRFEFEGVVVLTLGPTDDASLLLEDVEITIASMLEAAGETAGPGQEFLLEVWRDRSECDLTLFGSDPVKLFEISVNTGS